jgi:hypothetical protein
MEKGGGFHDWVDSYAQYPSRKNICSDFIRLMVSRQGYKKTLAGLSQSRWLRESLGLTPAAPCKKRPDEERQDRRGWPSEKKRFWGATIPNPILSNYCHGNSCKSALLRCAT